MRTRKLTASAVLAIGVMGITSGIAYAEPPGKVSTESQSTTAAPDVALRGVDRGVKHTTKLAENGTGIVTTVESGRFAMTRDAKTVTVYDQRGMAIENLPMTYQVAGKTVPLIPRISPDGHRLTLTPVGAAALSPTQMTALQKNFVALAPILSYRERNAVIGALIGAGIGFIVGFVPGALIGAAIGAGVGWVW